MRGLDLSGLTHTYRPVGAGDLKRLYALRCQPFLRRVWPPGSRAEFLSASRNDIRDRGVFKHLVYGGRDLIAFTEVNCNFGRRGRYWVGDRPGVASLDILLLDAAKRGQGHGRRIVEDVSERVLRLPGIKRVSLDPHPSNRAAIRAYRYAGFTPLGLYRNMEAEPGYILVRDRAP